MANFSITSIFKIFHRNEIFMFSLSFSFDWSLVFLVLAVITNFCWFFSIFYNVAEPIIKRQPVAHHRLYNLIYGFSSFMVLSVLLCYLSLKFFCFVMLVLFFLRLYFQNNRLNEKYENHFSWLIFFFVTLFLICSFFGY